MQISWGNSHVKRVALLLAYSVLARKVLKRGGRYSIRTYLRIYLAHSFHHRKEKFPRKEGWKSGGLSRKSGGTPLFNALVRSLLNMFIFLYMQVGFHNASYTEGELGSGCYVKVVEGIFIWSEPSISVLRVMLILCLVSLLNVHSWPLYI